MNPQELPTHDQSENMQPSMPDTQVHDRVRLNAGALVLEVSPRWGGSITQFYIETGGRRINLFHQADERANKGPLPLGAACFPMVPYAGRLRGGKYQYRFRNIRFPLDAFSEPNTSHGDGWMRPWQVSRCSQQVAVLSMLPIQAPPFRYRCRQVIRLSKDGLRVRIRLWNDEDIPMPVGIGLHPYFPRCSSPILTAALPKKWRFDEGLLPDKLQTNDLASEIALGAAISALPAHEEFWGWNGEATINWPSEGVSLRLYTEPRLHGAVLWAPHGRDFFCFEPVSHSTDAFNLSSHELTTHGVIILEPGAQLKQEFYFDLARTPG